MFWELCTYFENIFRGTFVCGTEGVILSIFGTYLMNTKIKIKLFRSN